MSLISEYRNQSRRNLTIALSLTALFFVVELIGGILSNSLALLSDAGHMFTDVLALGMSLLAMWIARKPPTEQKSYGFHRLEIFAALINGVTLAAISISIFVEAYRRFLDPPEVTAIPVIIVAAVGLLVNLISGYILHRSKNESINVRGAYLHVLGDALGSVGAILAGIIMVATGWRYADPLFSVLIGIIIVFSSIRLIRDTTHILMQGTPPHIQPDEVRESLCDHHSVTGVHDLHIWTLTSGIEAMTVHVNVDPELPMYRGDELIRELRTDIAEQFGIHHTTIQLERERPSDHRCVIQRH